MVFTRQLSIREDDYINKDIYVNNDVKNAHFFKLGNTHNSKLGGAFSVSNNVYQTNDFCNLITSIGQCLRASTTASKEAYW